MYYITVRLPKIERHMSIEELFFQDFYIPSSVRNADLTATRTYEVNHISTDTRVKHKEDIRRVVDLLKEFNTRTEPLRQKDRHELYTTFKIPKHSGGLRTINAPVEELKTELRNLKEILESNFGILYHISAYAYIPKRCNVDALKKHQRNESRWFFKTDFSDFFGSTTLNFLMKQLSMIVPFSIITEYSPWREELKKALELAFLDGGLPQGTPISPLLTNLMMIPIDYRLSTKLHEFDSHNFIYTRYADDILVSCKYDFDFKKVENLIHKTLDEFNAPFIIKPQKTRYGSSSGRNWNLGLMLNQNNEITVGHKKKKQFQSMLYSYVKDKENGIQWSIEDIRSLEGLKSYYHMVEPDVIDRIIEHMNSKLGVNIPQMIKADLTAV